MNYFFLFHPAQIRRRMSNSSQRLFRAQKGRLYSASKNYHVTFTRDFHVMLHPILFGLACSRPLLLAAYVSICPYLFPRRAFLLLSRPLPLSSLTFEGSCHYASSLVRPSSPSPCGSFTGSCMVGFVGRPFTRLSVYSIHPWPSASSSRPPNVKLSPPHNLPSSPVCSIHPLPSASSFRPLPSVKLRPKSPSSYPRPRPCDYPSGFCLTLSSLVW